MTRAFAWSLRRELWEHRAILYAPLAVAALVVVAMAFNARGLREKAAAFAALAPDAQVAAVALPFGLAASTILLTGFVVAVFYCIDALYAERRDRSILFWKSLPVSDRTTVLAKFATATVVQPAIACAIAGAVLVLILLGGAAALAVGGVAPGPLWARLPLLSLLVALVYGVAAHALWYAPIFAWLLLVSGWAKRAPLLWAVLPWIVAVALERIAFGTRYVSALIGHRLSGALDAAFVPDARKQIVTSLADLDPVGFAATPGLWLGLGFAAACLVAAIRLRRVRGPL
jgi:ABC-2 type transport system permease protein